MFISFNRNAYLDNIYYKKLYLNIDTILISDYSLTDVNKIPFQAPVAIFVIITY